MNDTAEGLYRGLVVHRRLRPISHRLRYRVFALLVDCERLDALAGRLRLFSHNRPNIFAIYDRDHGDGGPIGPYLRKIAGRQGAGVRIERFMMLCYPRVAGFAFNPLTVYYGIDNDGRIRLAVYEVNNTFGERRSYVLAADSHREDGVIDQTCLKTMRVSPFNSPHGAYSFRLTPPGKSIVVGVALRDSGGPVLKAYFRGNRRPLSDAALLRALVSTGWMTVNVIVGIHWEALKLWLKGLRPPTNESDTSKRYPLSRRHVMESMANDK